MSRERKNNNNTNRTLNKNNLNTFFLFLGRKKTEKKRKTGATQIPKYYNSNKTFRISTQM